MLCYRLRITEFTQDGELHLHQLGNRFAEFFSAPLLIIYKSVYLLCLNFHLSQLLLHVTEENNKWESSSATVTAQAATFKSFNHKIILRKKYCIFRRSKVLVFFHTLYSDKHEIVFSFCNIT